MSRAQHLYVHLVGAHKEITHKETYAEVLARTLKKRLALAHQQKQLREDKRQLQELQEHKNALFTLRKDVMKLEVALEHLSADTNKERIASIQQHITRIKEEIQEKEKNWKRPKGLLP